MGALRAAELVPFGMIGVGPIFEAYRDGLYTDDDEVALLHGPAELGYRAMSEPMVNIRATVARAIDDGVIGSDSGERVIRCAKDTFYQERSLRTAIAQAWGADASGDEAARFTRFLERGGYVDQKRLDALALLRRLDDLPPGRAQSRQGAAEVHRSSFILKLQHESMCAPFSASDTDLPREEQIALASAALGPTYHLLRRLAQFMMTAHALARGQGLTTTPRDVAGVYQRDDLGLGPRARTRRWAESQDLDDSARAALVERLSLIRAFVDASARRTGPREARRRRDAYLLDLMRLDGRYASWRPPGRGSGASIDRAVSRNAARRSGLEFTLYRRIAALWRVVDDTVDELGFAPVATLQALSDEFREAKGLRSREAALDWMRANNLTHDHYVALVSRQARLSALSGGAETHALGLLHLVEPVCWLLDAIRLSGTYAGLTRRLCHRVAKSGSAGDRVRSTVSARPIGWPTATSAPTNRT